MDYKISNLNKRSANKFCVKLKTAANEKFEMLESACSDECLSRTSAFEWQKRFVEGRESLQDDGRRVAPHFPEEKKARKPFKCVCPKLELSAFRCCKE
jgi:hypothetical protein